MRGAQDTARVSIRARNCTSSAIFCLFWQTAATFDTFGNTVTSTIAYENQTVVTAVDYDGKGRAVSQTDAHGGTVLSEPDSLGQTLSLSGATYPAQYVCDTQIRFLG